MAGEAAADEIHGSEVCPSDGANVIEELRFWPVVTEHAAAERFALYLPKHRAKAGSFEAQI